MGWKASTIIVNKPGQVNYEKLLKELGYANLKRTEDKPFEVVINPDNNNVYIGTYKDNLLICAPDIPMQFFYEDEAQVEDVLTRNFPDSEICSIMLHSTVNLWGYSIIKNGKKIRARAGTADDGTFVEIGEPLEEEKELLSKSTIGSDGKRTYMLDDFPDEPFSEDQVGENFVFEITGRYFGEQLDRSDDLLFETKLAGYSFGNVKQSEKVKQSENGSKMWWKFW